MTADFLKKAAAAAACVTLAFGSRFRAAGAAWDLADNAV